MKCNILIIEIKKMCVKDNNYLYFTFSDFCMWKITFNLEEEYDKFNEPDNLIKMLAYRYVTFMKLCLNKIDTKTKKAINSLNSTKYTQEEKLSILKFLNDTYKFYLSISNCDVINIKRAMEIFNKKDKMLIDVEEEDKLECVIISQFENKFEKDSELKFKEVFILTEFILNDLIKGLTINLGTNIKENGDIKKSLYIRIFNHESKILLCVFYITT